MHLVRATQPRRRTGLSAADHGGDRAPPRRGGARDLRILCDVYHLQRAGENLTETILANLGRIEHFEIADCPGRHQSGTGEINYRFVLDAIDRAGFDGWVCPEYVPLGGTEASLGWLRDWGYWA